MFNLDPAISQWRRGLRAAGIKSAVVLDELENHLREHVEQQRRSGSDPESAFNNAVQQLGTAPRLKSEFDQIDERTFMKRNLILAAAILAVLIGMALVMPAVAQYRHEGVMRNDEPWLFLIGSLMTLSGLGAAIRGFRGKRA